MRQRLLQHLSFAKPLRLALVLLTLLLTLPQTAWGDTVTTYSFTGTSGISNKTGTATSKVAGTEGYNWSIKEFSITNDQNVIQDITPTAIAGTLGYSNLGYSSYTADLTIESDFGITGCFVSATINYTTSDMSSGEVQVYNTNSNSPLALGTGNANKITMNLAQSTVTLNLDPTYNNEKFFNDNHISFQFTFKPNSASSSFQITSITITTTPISYGISVAGTPVTNGNASGITGTGISGTVKYTHNNDGTGTLTLNGATLTNKIRISRAEALTIELIGENSIQSDSSAIKADFGTTQTPPTPNLIFKGEGYVTLTPGSSYPAIGGFNVDITTNGMYAHGSLTTNGTSGIIAKKYDITVANTQVSSYNKDNVMANVSFTPANAGNNNTNTLTLNDVALGGTIESGLDALTIEFTGNNNSATYITSSNLNGALTIKGTGASTLTLDTGSSNTSAVSGFASLDYSSGTYLKSTDACRYKTDVKEIRSLSDNKISTLSFTTTPYYPLWIYGQQFSSAAIPLQSGTASYDATNQTLTLNNASLSNSNVIESELEGNLTISLIGDNSLIVNTGSNSPIMSGVSTAKLTIKNAGTDDCQLSLGFYGTSNPPVIKGFESISHTGLNFASKTGSSITDAATNDAVLSSATIYPLWVRGTMVTGINKGHILGASDTSVTFDGTNTLTLNGANFSGMIESGLGNLTIHLTGTNIIQQSNNETNLITSSNSGVLTFETDATPGDLSFLNFGNPVSVFSGTPFSGFSNIVYGTGIDYDDTNKKVCNISYPLTVAGTTVTSLNKNGVLGDNKVTFDPSSNTITLNGATINGNSGIVYNGTTDFTIALNGSNSIVNTNGNYAIVTNTTTSYSLKFEKATNASTAELALKWATGDKAISANDSILGSGLYWKPIAATQMTITDNPEFVIVGDYAISDGTPVNGATSGTITYNATDKLLTISSFSETYDKDAIRTGVSGLKVKLVGESVITCNTYDKRAFTAFTTSASIQFVKNDANSKLTMSTTLDPLYGFAAGAITYDGLFYYDAGNNKYIIRPKFSPTIKFVTRNQTDGSIPTTQSAYVYVPDNSTIPLTYGTDFYAPKPVFNDGYVLTDSTRYVYSMSVDGVVEFELGGTNYYNSDKILYADDGKLNILKSGELTITCSFPGNLQNEPCSASYTLKITRDFNNPFANQPAEQIYATYYNGDEDLTLPDGITAYVITGISGNTVTTTATGYLPHEVPVLLEKTGNVGTTITGYTGSTGNFSSNLLKYADQTFSSTGKEYVLYMNEFVKATGNIPDLKCYLDLSSVNPTRGMYGIGDGTTSIRELRMENEGRDEWYDLQGRRIEQPTKAGLYIKNGKKVIVNIK